MLDVAIMSSPPNNFLRSSSERELATELLVLEDSCDLRTKEFTCTDGFTLTPNPVRRGLPFVGRLGKLGEICLLDEDFRIPFVLGGASETVSRCCNACCGFAFSLAKTSPVQLFRMTSLMSGGFTTYSKEGILSSSTREADPVSTKAGRRRTVAMTGVSITW